MVVQLGFITELQTRFSIGAERENRQREK